MEFTEITTVPNKNTTNMIYMYIYYLMQSETLNSG